MLTQKQLLANRRNAKKSTGPRTAAGKAAVCGNAIRHAMTSIKMVVPGEKKKEFEVFRLALVVDLEPVGGLEMLLAERVVAAAWRLRRAQRVEVEMLRAIWGRERELGGYRQPWDRDPEDLVSLGEAVGLDFQERETCNNFRRYEAHIERGLYRALHELQRAQWARRGGAVPAPVALDVDVRREAA